MPRQRAPFRIRLVGRSPDHPRFVIRDNRRLVDYFYTGRGWSRRLRDARLYYDPDEVARAIDRLTRRHLRRHHSKRLYLITAVVRVHADGSVSRADVERYLRDALVVGVDHERYGTGPTPASLVEVIVPVINLEGAADMDLVAKIVAGLFVVWAGAIVVGLIISLMPVILFVVGFVAMMAILTLIGRLVASWFFY